MTIDTNSEIEEIREVLDADGSKKHAATDERLETVRTLVEEVRDVLQTEAIQTNNYDRAGSFGGAGYPLTVDPDPTIYELVLTASGDSIVADITTAGGDAINGVPLNGVTLALDTLMIDSVTFRDPDGTGVATEGFWIGGTNE
ncbi:hypothetical protein [Halorhabdus amylolytica]|uniref:hypothetical protein n=1 Tax=Halorhabdus amylolytica TaxID=2559573 RepID=UPI0010AA86EE|nr:hypothetical protein [Halorhabdus amylolytica]